MRLVKKMQFGLMRGVCVNCVDSGCGERGTLNTEVKMTQLFRDASKYVAFWFGNYERDMVIYVRVSCNIKDSRVPLVEIAMGPSGGNYSKYRSRPKLDRTEDRCAVHWVVSFWAKKPKWPGERNSECCALISSAISDICRICEVAAVAIRDHQIESTSTWSYSTSNMPTDVRGADYNIHEVRGLPDLDKTYDSLRDAVRSGYDMRLGRSLNNDGKIEVNTCASDPDMNMCEVWNNT